MDDGAAQGVLECVGGPLDGEQWKRPLHLVHIDLNHRVGFDLFPCRDGFQVEQDGCLVGDYYRDKSGHAVVWHWCPA